MEEYIDGSNQDFCTDYFEDSTLISQCEAGGLQLPDDVEGLDEDVVINALDNNNEFEVLTKYPNGDSAYRFLIEIVEISFCYCLVSNTIQDGCFW